MMSSATQSSITYDPETRYLQLPRAGYGDAFWTKEDKHFKEIFERAEFFSTKFACRKTLQKMGIAERVDELLASRQLGRLAHMDYHLYPDLCRDFLSTINLIEVDGTLWLEFLLEDRKYQLSMTAFYNIYGFPYGDFEPLPRFSHSSNVWSNIALPVAFVERESRLSMVKNPVIRYALNLLATTYFGRHKSSFSNTTELSFLYNEIRGAMTVAPEHQILEFYPPSNPGSIFFRKLIHTKL